MCIALFLFHIVVSTVGLGGRIFTGNIDPNHREATLHSHCIAIGEKTERKAESERKTIDIYKCARKNSLWVRPVTPFPWEADARE